VHRAVVLVSPCQIGGLVGHVDRAKMVPLRVPTPISLMQPEYLRVFNALTFGRVTKMFPFWSTLMPSGTPSQVPAASSPKVRRHLANGHHWQPRKCECRSEEHTSELQSPDHLVC